MRQIEVQPDTSLPLSAPNKTTVQQIIGYLFYYARVLDNTMLVAFNIIAQSQSNPTQHAAKSCQRILDYCAMYPNLGLRYHKNDMVLYVHSDASRLIASCSKSNISEYFCLSSNTTYSTTHNVPIHIESKTLENVVTSSAECERAVVYHNAQKEIHIRYLL